MLCTFYSTIGYLELSIKVLQSSKIINAIGTKWYELGIELLDENQSSQLNTIKRDHNETTKCCIAMFDYWLQSHDSAATWHKLIYALRSSGVQLNNVATMVEKLLSGK